jgi:hypothetical protein
VIVSKRHRAGFSNAPATFTDGAGAG